MINMVTSERTRRELEQMCKDQRAEEKCVLTKALHAEAKELMELAVRDGPLR